ENMSSEATEYVRGVPVVKVFGQSVHSFRRFKDMIDNFGKWATEYTLMLRMPMTAFMTCINAVFAFLVLGAFILAKGGVTQDIILNVMYYIIVTPLLTVTLTKIAYSGEQEMVVVDALERIDHIMKIEPLADKTGTAEPKENGVTLENVSFRYKDAQTDAVHGLNISIAGGEHIALVGPSGGGKTTTAELVARFFDVSVGCIKIGGVDIRELDQKKMMERVSFVFQDSRLLKTSILDNVRLARPDADEEAVTAALKAAQCEDIIDKLPKGIHTVVGDKGVYLSGGEQQRISIARAILKNAPILILDEATAFADPDNETKVQNAIAELAKGKTVIMIAHRLSTVKNCDCIYVMKDGSVCESGTHQELMGKNGLYKSMYEEYSRSVNWKVGA
nr:ABC transporter ATP-binding protein/permease [Ruminococcus sp.]